jgi:hypothetical protein
MLKNIRIMKMTMFILLMVSFVIDAADIDSAMAIQNKTNMSSANSQTLINTRVQKSNELNNEIEQLKAELHNMKIYKRHLDGLITDQNNEIESLNNQISDISKTRQGIIPLMYNMLDELELLITQDKPIKKSQRLARLNELRKLMTSADVSDAEKYRRILEAYQIELQYGNKMSAYRGNIDIGNKHVIEADIFHLGRAVLIARSIDQSRYWNWDLRSQSWIEGDPEYLQDIDQAYALVNKKIAPTLLMLPVSLQRAGSE